jgi:competence protein ComEC
MRRPLIPFLVAFMLGITIGNFYRVPNQPLIISLLIILILLLITSIKKSDKLNTIFAILSFVLLGLLNINLCLYLDPGSTHIVHYITKEKMIVEGIVSENPQESSDRTELIVSARRLIKDDSDFPVHGHILLSVAGDQEINYGDFIRFTTRLRAPRSFHNPGGFDYEKYLKYRGVIVRGFIKDSSGIVILRENQGNIFKTKLEQVRKKIKNFIEDNSFSPEREIIQAMILGNHGEIPKELMEKFNKTGTTHIIAISGFNIGIIAFLSFFTIRLLMRTSTYLLLRFNIVKVSTIFGIIPVVIYTFIAGMGISVVRASIMALTFMIAIILGKDRDLYNTLALAALIILLFSPPSLYDVSFQLSFVAVWAILFITPKFTALFPQGNTDELSTETVWAKKTFANIYIFVFVSLAATLGTLPFIVYYFNRVSTIVLLSNLIVVPIMGIIAIPVCMSIIVALPLSDALALVFLNIASYLVRISISIVDFFASLPGSSFFVSTPTLLEMGAYYLLLVVTVKLFDIWRHKEDNHSKRQSNINQKLYRISLAALTVFFIVDTIYLYARDIHNDKMKVTFIDIGQGNSTLIELPGGKKILLDGGGSYENIFDIGKYVVAPFLWHERIKNIDIVILSHPHPDHLNGLITILSNFDVKEVWTNGEEGYFETYEDFMKIIREKNITHRLISEKSGVTLISGTTLSVFNPLNSIDVKNDLPRKFDMTNNDSLVIKLTFGKVSFLLPGDISESSETRLVKSGRDIKSQVMLVPHHGGFTSSTMPFLDKVQPEFAIVSCGSDNYFNDPHPDVLKRFSRIGTKILRTDINGAISVTTDGTTITYTTFR